MQFDEWKKIYEAVNSATIEYEMKVFKPWESDGGKQYITIQLIKKEEEK